MYQPQNPYPPGSYPLLYQPRRIGAVHVTIAWVLAVLTTFYLLPWAIAATRDKANTTVIAVINLFLGWTAVGWVIALVLACLRDSPRPPITIVNQYAAPGYPPQLQYQQPAYPQPAYQQPQYPQPAYPQPAYQPTTVPQQPADTNRPPSAGRPG